jgi:tripartite ATP-independent transporter DctP family solute receptor
MTHTIARRTILRTAAVAPLFAPPIIGRARAAALRLRFSSSQSSNPKYANGQVFYDNLQKRLGEGGIKDQIDVQFFPDNQLGQEIDIVNSIRLGVVDMMVTGTSIWANLFPTFGLLDLGYLFDSFEQQTKALDTGAGKMLDDMFYKATGARMIAWAYNFGARSILCKTPVSDPASLSGKKIRTLPSPTITEVLRLMGAAATPLAFGEVYTAMQAGVLDGVEHDPPTILSSKFSETAKHYCLTEHIFSPLGCFFSDVTYRRMDPKLRTGFLDAAQKAALDIRSHGLTVAKEALTELEAQGVKVVTGDRAAFRARVLPQTEAFMKAHPDSKPIVEHIRATTV